MNQSINRKSISSRNSFWPDADAARLCTAREAIDLTSGEGQCRSFCRTVDGGTHDSISGEVVIGSVIGVDETTPLVLVAR